MKVYQLLRIGEHHINHCEDYAVVENIDQSRVLCAVMDGCTMGNESYFAATLVGKLLKKIAIEKNYNSFYAIERPTTLEEDLKEILSQLFTELKTAKSLFLLKDDELLTTLMLLLIDTEKNEGRVIVIGDGLVCINGKLTEYDHDNIPDYVGYHVGEDFEEWFSKQTQLLSIDHISDVSISTDGISTFAKHDKQDYPEQKDPINYLLIDKQDEEVDTMLSKKLTFLERQCGLKPTDDVGIIRIVKNHNPL